MEFLTFPRGSLDWNPDAVARWTALAAASGKPDPFSCGPAWQLSFHEAFHPDRRLLLRVESDASLAFSELVLPSGAIIFTPPESHWISGCPLLGREPERLLERALPFLADACRGRLPCFLIGGLADDDDLPLRLIRRFGNRFRFLEQEPSRQRGASLDGGFDGYLSRRSGNFRAKMKKAKKNADALGLRFEAFAPDDPSLADALYARMLAVEEKSWKGRDHCGMAESPSREFYGIMLRRLSRRREGRVIFARLDGRDVGFIFGGLCGARYRGQQFSYDDAFKRLSVGDLLQLEQIRRLCDEGVLRYDMGMSDHPSMAYKARWAESELSLRAWLLIPRIR